MPNLIHYLAEYAPGVSAAIAALALVAGGIKFGLEYRKQNSLRRFETFHKMRDIGRNDPFISEAIDCLRDFERGKPGAADRLREMDIKKKHRFLAFFEEVAIMHDSGLIKTDVAHYMFGYFCIRCLEVDEFWIGIEQRSYYWSLFMRFARLMQQIEAERLQEHHVRGNTPTQHWPRRFKF
jgi:hypothetical protein